MNGRSSKADSIGLALGLALFAVPSLLMYIIIVEILISYLYSGTHSPGSLLALLYWVRSELTHGALIAEIEAIVFLQLISLFGAVAIYLHAKESLKSTRRPEVQGAALVVGGMGLWPLAPPVLALMVNDRLAVTLTTLIIAAGYIMTQLGFILLAMSREVISPVCRTPGTCKVARLMLALSAVPIIGPLSAAILSVALVILRPTYRASPSQSPDTG
ncbi:MAG: hypothetical protein F7C35_07710 [Desulfurococcales archaeon]|nr:hypothetical protein [Desulfurococcales archaeon]